MNHVCCLVVPQRVGQKSKVSDFQAKVWTSIEKTGVRFLCVKTFSSGVVGHSVLSVTLHKRFVVVPGKRTSTYLV